MNASKSNFLTKRELLIFLGCSTLFVMFLFFIDEGYYSFESFTKIENLVPFLLYLVVALAGQILLANTYYFFTKKQSITWVSALLGPVVSVSILIAVLLAFN